MIFITTQNFPPAIGGIETLVYSLASTLAKTGESITVFADSPRGVNTADFDQSCDFRVQRIAGIKPLRRRKKARVICKLARSQTDKRSILVADSWKSLEHINKEEFSRILCLAHGTEVPQQASSYKRKRIQKALSKASHVVANSHYTARQLQQYVCMPEKSTVIYPGIDPPVREDSVEQEISTILDKHDPVLITTARLAQRKGQQHVIGILPQLIEKFPSLLYVVAGSGSTRAHLGKLAAASGVSDHVLFTGALNAAQKSAYLANSDLFVMPGSYVGGDVEGFGMAYLEAACFGVPSVACNIGGAPEAVLHDQTGLVCEPDDPQQLLHAVLELLQNRDLYNRLANNALNRSTAFLWENRIKEYLRLLG